MSIQPNNCDFCRGRKLKCSREKPVCSSCLQLGKKCVYTPRPKRAPITKRYVSQLQDRIRELEAIVGKEPVIKAGSDSPNSQVLLSDISPTSFEVVKREDMIPYEDVDALDWSEGDSTSGEEGIVTSLPKPVKKNSLVDGMGASAVGQSTDSSHSYYGVTSSHGILKFLTDYKSTTSTNEDIATSKLPYMSALTNPTNSKLLKSDKLEMLLDSKQHRDDFFNSYFDTYHTCFPFLNESLIRDEYSRNEKNPIYPQNMSFKDKIFQTLLNTILAVGCLMKLGEGSVIDLLYYKRVKYWLQKVNIMEACNYQLLESLVLLGNYVQKRNKPNTAWNYHGIALRMAITFGLHKEIHVDPTSITKGTLLENLERRRRLWWCLFYFDVGHSLTFGRPLHTLRLESIDIRYPSNVDDLSLTTNKGALSDIVKPYPTIHDSLIQEAKLAKISYLILNEITSARASQDNNGLSNKLKTYLKLNDLIEDFCKSMPSYFDENDEVASTCLSSVCPPDWYEITLNGDLNTPKWFPISRRKIIWRYKNVQILMFRSFIWDVKDISLDEHQNLERALDIGYDASKYTIYSVSKFVQNEILDTHSSWYCTYFLFQAVLVPLLFWIREIRGGQDGIKKVDILNVLESITIAEETLTSLQEHNLLASKLLETLRTLLNPLKDTETANDSSLGHLSSATINLFSNIEVDFKVDLSPNEYFSSMMNTERSIPDAALQTLEEELFPQENWDKAFGF